MQYCAARIELTNPALATDLGDLPAQQIGLSVRRRVTHGIHEDLDLVSYAEGPVHVQLEIALRSDFADIFEVRSHKSVRRGNTQSRWHDERCELHTTYVNGDFHRGVIFQLVDFDSKPQFANGGVVFDISLSPGQSWHTCACYHLDDGRPALSTAQLCLRNNESSHDELGTLQSEWKSAATQLSSGNEDVYRAFAQSVEDMGALRMHEQDLARNVWLPAAGVPWYVALFGRESLIASLQNMMVSAPFARGALQRLADYQADDYRRLARRRAWQDSARIARWGTGARTQNPAHPVLRHSRCDHSVSHRVTRDLEVDWRPNPVAPAYRYGQALPGVGGPIRRS